MSLPYFFIEIIPPANTILLPEETSKHCVQVLRMKAGDHFMLTDGKGSLLKAHIKVADKKKCTVLVEEKKFQEPIAKKICIGISILKNAARFEWFLEKATEIGVSEIIPLICKRTERQHFRFERMHNIVVSAMLQSQQAWLPVLHEPLEFKKVITASNYIWKYIAHCEKDVSKNKITATRTNNIQILIGPEGDFTSEEIRFASDNHYHHISLGNTRLRSETAGIVAAALLLNT